MTNTMIFDNGTFLLSSPWKARQAPRMAAGLMLALLLASGCATRSKPDTAQAEPQRAPDRAETSMTERAVDAAAGAARETGVGVREAARETRSGVGDAASQPLKDIGLMRKDIPDVLRRIDYAYMPPPSPSCEVIAEEVAALDAVLGPDHDWPSRDRSLGQRGGQAAGDAIVDAMRSGASSVIPARGVVRWISGADRHDKRVNQAIERGQIRRAYLKGLGEALGCPPPAAPLPQQTKAAVAVELNAPPDASAPAPIRLETTPPPN